MTEGWELKDLKSVCQIKPPKKEAKQLLKDSDSVSFVPMNALGIDEKYFSAVASKPLGEVSGSYTYFRDGDVLLAKITPCFENGKLGIATSLENGIGFGSSEFIVYRPREELFPEFLYYFLNQPSFRETGASQMTGAVGHKRIPKNFYEGYSIPIPPLEEQKRIVAVLDKAFAAIDQAKANIEKNLQNAKELFQSTLNEIFCFDKLSKQNEGWEERTLGELGKVSMCKRILKKQTSTSGDIPFYKIGTFGKEPNAFISQNIYDEYRKRFSFPKKGDVLLSASGTIGRRVIYNGEPAYFQDSNIIWIDNDESKVLNKFLYYLYATVVWKTEGGTIQRLYNDNIKKIKIPVPPLAEQERIVSILDKFDALVNDISIGLPAELSARRSQYEYYRGKLLTFKEYAK